MENNYKILGVRVDNFSKKEILEKVEDFLREDSPRTINNINSFDCKGSEIVRGKFHQIATINPEFILEAQKDIEFKNILNNCDLNVADGFGIKLAFWRYGRHLKTRMAGADLTQEILKIADEKKLKILLAVNKDGLSGFEEIKKAILKIYPNLEIAGADLNKTQVQTAGFPETKGSGETPEPAMNFNCHPREGGDPVQKPKDMKLDSRLRGNDKDSTSAHTIAFCNFGAPYQEKFIHSLKNTKDSKIKLAMGVGGSFDFLTGKIRRAPKIIRAVGLEWFWRFILEPKYRLKRIWNATIVFMFKII